MEITQSGIYTMSAEEYHSDPCPTPSLSSSLARRVLESTPMHAYLQRRGAFKIESDDFDIGRAAHSLLLENNLDALVEVKADSWRTTDAKKARDEARANGKSPLLSADFKIVQDMRESALEFVNGSEIAGIFDNGKPEQSVFAFDGCWLRGRFDFMTNNRKVILDYKTVRNANPEAFVQRSVPAYGYDLQAAFYLELNRLTGFEGTCHFIWLLQEKEYPYLCSLVGASDTVLEIGQKKLAVAKALWCQSLESGEFKAYHKRIVWPEAPAWQLAKSEMLGIEDFI